MNDGAATVRQRRSGSTARTARGEQTSLLSCPACGGATRHDFLYTKNGCDILRCDSCGLGRAKTDSFDPKNYYTEDYFSGKRSDGYADYLGAEPVLRREFAKTMDFIRGFRPSGRLLEVGCAYGFLLQEARLHFDVTGIELAGEAAEHCRRSGLRVLTGQVNDGLLADLGRFDVIVMLDVIEHLPSPRETVAALARHLAPGGVLVITTGDFGAISARLAGRHWRLMTPPQHLWFFSQQGMRRMAAAVGLTVAQLDHPWKIVPLSLIGFQLTRMLGVEAGRLPGWSGAGIPINLFDAMRVVLRKPNP